MIFHEAGIYIWYNHFKNIIKPAWIPAFAGMTEWEEGMTKKEEGMTKKEEGKTVWEAGITELLAETLMDSRFRGCVTTTIFYFLKFFHSLFTCMDSCLRRNDNGLTLFLLAQLHF
ncbi:hypothetical protein OMAG_001899 [Candidatus Omnitrophus magneticus]|uniref:Uncharacterized protein n=1 Tax=Candidatus Omnitrophus magneticus TaxID=1609969 RepID=A0A0F0CS19_9BACT|nr:hypothetical protein OMAG_001899 [Candidatus Omnitrophus magneticus]